jgi:hypothetical protein
MTEDNPVVRFRETSVLSSSPQLQGRLAHAGQPRSLRRMLVRNLGSWRFVAYPDRTAFLEITSG